MNTRYELAVFIRASVQSIIDYPIDINGGDWATEMFSNCFFAGWSVSEVELHTNCEARDHQDRDQIEQKIARILSQAFDWNSLPFAAETAKRDGSIIENSWAQIKGKIDGEAVLIVQFQVFSSQKYYELSNCIQQYIAADAQTKYSEFRQYLKQNHQISVEFLNFDTWASIDTESSGNYSDSSDY